MKGPNFLSKHLSHWTTTTIFVLFGLWISMNFMKNVKLGERFILMSTTIHNQNYKWPQHPSGEFVHHPLSYLHVNFCNLSNTKNNMRTISDCYPNMTTIPEASCRDDAFDLRNLELGPDSVTDQPSTWFFKLTARKNSTYLF